MRGRGGWRCASEGTGEQCAVMDGQKMIHWWCADSLGMTSSVSCALHTCIHAIICSVILVFVEAVPVTNASFGRGSGPVHMTSVSCRGDEKMLSDCEYTKGIGAINCHHARDAGVICTGMKLLLCLLVECYEINQKCIRTYLHIIMYYVFHPSWSTRSICNQYCHQLILVHLNSIE